jgi:hypothetical protein
MEKMNELSGNIVMKSTEYSLNPNQVLIFCADQFD